jgi:hypothetical protein
VEDQLACLAGLERSLLSALLGEMGSDGGYFNDLSTSLTIVEHKTLV